MRRMTHRLCGTIGRLAGALAMAATLALGSGTSGATALEPPDRPMLHATEADSRTPVYARQTVTLQPIAMKSYAHSHNGPHPIASPFVGWSQEEKGFPYDDYVWVSETAVKFDVAGLDIDKGKVTRAILRFDERGYRWTSGSGESELKDGCVAHLGITTTDWADQSIISFFPNDRYSSAPDGAARAWEVTRHVQRQVASPRNASLHHGFVLQGATEIGSLRGDDDTSCMSTVSNVRLEITIETDERPVPNPVPKPAPKPAPPPPPTKPDLAITRLFGPTEVFDGVTARYEVALWNYGTPADKTAQVQINLAGALELVEIVQTGVNPNKFTCQPNEFGTSCTGSLGGEGDPVQTQGTGFTVVARGKGAGKAVVLASADHFATLDEMSEENNVEQLEVTVK